ncbi:MAG: LPS-assembly protein LptD [Halocynthiibacter sp.]
MARRFVVLIILALLALPAGARAQEAATLIADNLSLRGTTGIIAEGNVEIFFRGVRLRASRVIYDGATETLQIDGPITLTEGATTVLVADSASLDATLRNGVLRGARLVLDQQLQLAATELRRVGGRYTLLLNTVASSCSICGRNAKPLWQIRASSVVHDQEARQLYFKDAQLVILNVPVFYLPRLRLPDPTLKRATGFLIPSVRSTSQFGLGIKIPYFFKLGDSRDLTLTPYLASSTATLELRYRQAFRRGNINFTGAVSNDDLRPDSTRWYVFGDGRFDLPRDYKLEFDVEMTSDPAYLLDYGYSGADRLESAVEVSRARRDEFISAELIYFNSLRDTEDNDKIPSVVGDAVYIRRFEPGGLGGDATLQFDVHSQYRRSTIAGDDGRDIVRASAALDWRRDWFMANGMIAAAMGGLNADYYGIAQGAPGDRDGLFYAATVGAELRWPFARTTAGGASHVIEPVVQLLWTDEAMSSVPNEDSSLLEFDEGNLFSFSRFPGSDVYERGLRANIGVSWTRYDPAGWSLGLTVGRILRQQDLGQFTAGSGLTGSRSDWMAAVQLQLPDNLQLTSRSLFDDGLSFTRNETRIDWRGNRLALASSYIWMVPAPAESRPKTAEWTLNSEYRINDRWTGKANWRYDFNENRAANAGIGLEYRNECVKIDLSLSRRFTSSISVSPTTDFGLSISLMGFSTGGPSRPASRKCNN